MTIDSAGERLNSAAADRAEFRLALDIGTEYVKALVVVCGERPEVLGVGRVRQRHGHMEGARLQTSAALSTLVGRRLKKPA